jgi:hypothetical protein
VPREREPVDLRAVDLRAAAGLARLAFARVEAERDAPALFARAALDFARDPEALRAAVAGLRVPVERLVAVLRVAVERAARDVPPESPVPVELSSVHLPDMTRWAASATASAISAPSLVALVTMLLAACDAVSAASSPASRIARRAFGLALIAAAAAASPAASISLLIAALASLSAVVVPEPADDFLDAVFLEDLAIVSLPQSREKTLQNRNSSLAVCEVGGIADMLKGTAARCSGALRHGQRPKVWPFVSI